MEKTELNLLKQSTVFSSLPVANLVKLADMFTEASYAAGSYIFREGDPGDSVMLIKSGIVEIIKRGESGGTDVHLADRGPGEIFGEMALIEKSPRFADAKARTEVAVLALQKEQFDQLLVENPSVVLEIMGTLSSKLRQADLQMIDDLERKNSDLIREKEFRDKIINHAPFFMIITDSQGRVAIMNGSAERTFGISSDQAYGKTVEDIIESVVRRDIFGELNRSLAEKGVWNGELICKGAGNTPTFIDMTAVSVTSGGEGDEDSTILYMGNDITEAKQIQRQAFQLERMATRGEMAAEIAHELNNFLAIVSGNLELLVMDLDRKRFDRIDKKAASMKEGIGRIAKFVEGLMSVARPEAKLEIFDIHQFIDNEIFFLKPQPKFKELQIVRGWGENVPTIEIDRGQLQQVLFNLLNNAADALADVPAGQKRVTISTSYSESEDMISLVLYDNGCGMSEEDYSRVFRQHFTTKKTGHGFGLLAVKRVVKAHGGRISVSKGPEGGACFQIDLPRRIHNTEKRKTTVNA